MARRDPNAGARGTYWPQIETGLRHRLARWDGHLFEHVAKQTALLDSGHPFRLDATQVDLALIDSGDELAWRRWRADHMGRDGHAWHPNDPDARWIYDPATATLRPSADKE